MNLTYAVADLHGANDLLELALAAIHEHAAAAPAAGRAVVFLGDYVDRGPGSRQIIERLIAGPPEGWRWNCLKGNHEDMMVETLRKPLHPEWWLQNGGTATLCSYGHPTSGSYDMDVVPLDHVTWMENLPSLATDTHRVFVHAGVDPTIPLADQLEHDLLWSRSSNALGHGGRFVVHGHTPRPNGPVTDGQSINLDTYAWETGRLVVGVFDDDRAGGPVDLFEVRRRSRS